MTSRFAAILATLTLSAALFAAPVSAQNDAPDGADLLCEPGAMGEGGEFVNPQAADGEVTRLTSAYQCGETLSDGTFIPEGYRVQAFRKCAPEDCALPMVMATPDMREGLYRAFFRSDKGLVTLRMRTNPRGLLVLNVATITEDRERTRERFRLRPAR